MKASGKFLGFLKRYTHMDMVQPATPRLVALVKSVRLSAKDENNRESPIAPAKSTAMAFVEHWVQHGWTIPRLVRAYAAMRRTGLLYLVFISISVTVIMVHISTSQNAQPILTATSILATAMLIMSYLNLAMLCWRIRTETLDARLWLAQLTSKEFMRALWIPSLPHNYTQQLKGKYDAEKKRRQKPPSSA